MFTFFFRSSSSSLRRAVVDDILVNNRFWTFLFCILSSTFLHTFSIFFERRKKIDLSVLKTGEAMLVESGMAVSPRLVRHLGREDFRALPSELPTIFPVGSHRLRIS